jgi:hypothetical protein
MSIRVHAAHARQPRRFLFRAQARTGNPDATSTTLAGSGTDPVWIWVAPPNTTSAPVTLKSITVVFVNP